MTTPQDDAQIFALIEQWRAWHREINDWPGDAPDELMDSLAACEIAIANCIPRTIPGVIAILECFDQKVEYGMRVELTPEADLQILRSICEGLRRML